MRPQLSSRALMMPLLALLALALTAALPSGPGARRPSGDLVEMVPGQRSHPTADTYTLFESGQVRPLALSPDGRRLFAVNTPDNRLEVFHVRGHKLDHAGSIPVGLEPVAVAARSDHEVWVVNHLSDSVSIVELDQEGGNTEGRVVRTLLVGDEPRDIVFAGPGGRRAFVTAAHRGQNLPFDPQLSTPGVGRADVWVFDAEALGSPLGGTPLSIVTLFTDTPRALAATPDGSRVYAAGFHTGNQTSIVPETSLPDGFGPDGAPGPATNAAGVPAPEVSAIVKWNGTDWVDALGRPRSQFVRFSLPDKDVFVLDAMADPPGPLAGAAGTFQGVGTVLYNMAVNPVNGKVYVANTEANNAARFEGPGTFAGHSIRGHLHESRITVLAPGGGVAARHLNKHIDYDSCCEPAPAPENERSLALPNGLAVSGDGATLYVAALGSDKVGIFSTAEVEADTFVPGAGHVRLTGGGPTGLVLDEARGQLYVMTRFDNGISVLDTKKRREASHVRMHNPEPPSIVTGRRFLYDAKLSSSNGESACASCHVFGDLDSLAWDLGNPDGEVIDDPGPFISQLLNLITGQPMEPILHPMKGPMVTQSLRGLANHGPMHWRGDRTGGNTAPNQQPDGGAFDERAAFDQFNEAFPGLLGRHEKLAQADMNAFTDFVLRLTYPPNPNRRIDNVLTPDQEAGRQLFNTVNCGIPPAAGIAGPLSCNDCHKLDPNANPGTPAPGFFGTSGQSSFAFNPQLFKIPHLRNAYQKVGMFGNPENPGFLPTDTSHQGDQVRGYGLLHDGTLDTVFRFMHGLSFSEVFNGPGSGGFPDGPEGEVQRRQLEAFVLAFPTNLAPVVGQQVTLSPESPQAAVARANVLRQRAEAGECDLIAKARLHGDEAGFLYLGSGLFARDRQNLPPITAAALRKLGTDFGSPVTYTCLPPGSGQRAGVDRDGDGAWDGDERDAGTDPADTGSRP